MFIKKVIFVFAGLILLSSTTNAQFDNLFKKAKEKVKRKIEREVDKAMDEGIEEADKAVKEGVSGDSEKEEKNNQSGEENDSSVESQNESLSDNDSGENKEELKLWSKYNFVPGDKIIFEDNLAGEENGEFPSRWDLVAGNAENAVLGDENVISFKSPNTIIKPLMDRETYLPEVFTLEFDAYFDKDSYFRTQRYQIRFFDGSSYFTFISKKKRYYIEIRPNGVIMNKMGELKNIPHNIKKSFNGAWKHIAIAFNKRSLKIFIDQDRFLNVPNLGYKPEMFSIGVNYDARYIKKSAIKNIRLAEGGKKLYDRIIADGKFVTRGILFDVNKATIKPESMGVINKIVKLMKEHPDLKFRIEGHTDSDGDEDFNQKLSEKRAEAVKNALVNAGIDSSRLETKGFGESKPVADNSTPEGKANNRRVEFVKI